MSEIHVLLCRLEEIGQAAAQLKYHEKCPEDDLPSINSLLYTVWVNEYGKLCVESTELTYDDAAVLFAQNALVGVHLNPCGFQYEWFRPLGSLVISSALKL